MRAYTGRSFAGFMWFTWAEPQMSSDGETSAVYGSPSHVPDTFPCGRLRFAVCRLYVVALCTLHRDDPGLYSDGSKPPGGPSTVLSAARRLTFRGGRPTEASEATYATQDSLLGFRRASTRTCAGPHIPGSSMFPARHRWGLP
ncbi:hypothetical protein MTO96_016530 [Rhipicephalus appendiculatus]